MPSALETKVFYLKTKTNEIIIQDQAKIFQLFLGTNLTFNQYRIQGRKIFKGGNYMRKYSICISGHFKFWLLNNKFRGLSPSHGCASLSFDQRVPKKLPTTSPSSWLERHLTVFYIDQIVPGFVVYISISKLLKNPARENQVWFTQLSPLMYKVSLAVHWRCT